MSEAEREAMHPEKGTMLQADGTEFDWAAMVDAIWDKDNHCLKTTGV